MKQFNLNADNVILMLGKTNAFYIEIDGNYHPTKYNNVSQYHAMLWLKDIEYRTKTAQAILKEWFYNF